jgi:hypothetical protein
MSYSYTYAENENLRVVIEADEYAPEPDGIYGPLVRVTLGSYRMLRDSEILTVDEGQTDNNGNSDYELAEKLSEAIGRFTERNDRDEVLDLVSRYFRCFYGMEVHYDLSDGYQYVAIGDSGKDYLDEYMAWVDGDVYSIVTEKAVAEHTVTFDKATNEVLDELVTDTWEEVDRTGGYYGERYAETEAATLWSSLTQE